MRSEIKRSMVRCATHRMRYIITHTHTHTQQQHELIIYTIFNTFIIHNIIYKAGTLFCYHMRRYIHTGSYYTLTLNQSHLPNDAMNHKTRRNAQPVTSCFLSGSSWSRYCCCSSDLFKKILEYLGYIYSSIIIAHRACNLI